MPGRRNASIAIEVSEMRFSWSGSGDGESYIQDTGNKQLSRMLGLNAPQAINFKISAIP